MNDLPERRSLFADAAVRLLAGLCVLLIAGVVVLAVLVGSLQRSVAENRSLNDQGRAVLCLIYHRLHPADALPRQCLTASVLAAVPSGSYGP